MQFLAIVGLVGAGLCLLHFKRYVRVKAAVRQPHHETIP